MNQPVHREQLDDETVAILQALSPHERPVIASAIREEVRQLIITAVRTYHPTWPPERIQHAVAHYMIPRYEHTPWGIAYTQFPPGFEETFPD